MMFLPVLLLTYIYIYICVYIEYTHCFMVKSSNSCEPNEPNSSCSCDLGLPQVVQGLSVTPWGHPKWMVCKEKSYPNGWLRDIYHHFRKPPCDLPLDFKGNGWKWTMYQQEKENWQRLALWLTNGNADVLYSKVNTCTCPNFVGFNITWWLNIS